MKELRRVWRLPDKMSFDIYLCNFFISSNLYPSCNNLHDFMLIVSACLCSYMLCLVKFKFMRRVSLCERFDSRSET